MISALKDIAFLKIPENRENYNCYWCSARPIARINFWGGAGPHKSGPFGPKKWTS